jgi:hypothetical protein
MSEEEEEEKDGVRRNIIPNSKFFFRIPPY